MKTIKGRQFAPNLQDTGGQSISATKNAVRSCRPSPFSADHDEMEMGNDEVRVVNVDIDA